MTDETNNNGEMSEEERQKKKKELKRQVRKTPKQRAAEKTAKDPKMQGGSPGTVFKPNQEVAADGSIYKPDPTQQDIQEALQDEDMEQGDFLQDPEFEFNETTDIRNSHSLYEQDNADKGFSVESIGKSIQAILSIPDMIDKRAGIGEFNMYNARQGLIRAFTGGLSEKHVLAALLGEIIVPDTIDLATLGMAYIPKRVWKLASKSGDVAKVLRHYLKGRAAKNGMQLAQDSAMVERAARATGRNLDEAFNESGLLMAIKKDPIDEWTGDALARLRKGEELNDDELYEAYKQYNSVPKPKLEQMELQLFKKPEKAGDIPLFNQRALKRMGMTEDEARLFSTEIDFNKIPRDDKAALQNRYYGPQHFNNTKRYLMGKYMGYYSRIKHNIISNGRIDPRFFNKKYAGIPMRLSDRKNFKLEAHHINPLASAMPLYDGATMTEIDKVTDILFKNGVMSGNNPLNVTLIPESVHEVGHRYIRDFLEKAFAGQYFKRRYVNSSDRYAAAKKYANVIKNSEKAIMDAYFQHWLLFGEVIPDDVLVAALQRVPLFSRYNLKTMQDIIREAGTDKKALEQITVLTRNDGKKFIRKNATLSEKEAAMADLKELYRQKRNLPKETSGRFKGSTFTSMRGVERELNQEIDKIEKAYRMGKYKYLQRDITGLKPDV